MITPRKKFPHVVVVVAAAAAGVVVVGGVGVGVGVVVVLILVLVLVLVQTSPPDPTRMEGRSTGAPNVQHLFAQFDFDCAKVEASHGQGLVKSTKTKSLTGS